MCTLAYHMALWLIPLCSESNTSIPNDVHFVKTPQLVDKNQLAADSKRPDIHEST